MTATVLSVAGLSVAGLSTAPAEADVSYQHTYTIGCSAQGMTDLINAFKDIGGYWTTSAELSAHRLVQNFETDHIVLAQNCTYNFPGAFDGGNALPAIGGGYYGKANVRVTIDGNGSTFARTGSDRYRFLSVQDTGAELTVNNLTFTGGAAPNGAGIHADAFMSQLCGPLGGLRGCSDAEADDGGDGGAIASVGVVRLSGTTFSSNIAGDGHQAKSNVPDRKGGRGGSGGAVYSSPQSWLFVDGSTFSGNRAGAGGTGATMGGLFEVGGMGGDGGMGGAIGSFGHLQITNSTFRSNLSGGPGGPGKGILGTTTAGAIGGFYGSGGALAVGSTSAGASVESSTFVDNGNAGGYGGAIDGSGTLTVTNSTFQRNGASWGGAIWNSNATVNVRSSAFVGNYSDNSGDVFTLPFGGKFDIANSVIVVPTTGAHTACANTSGFGAETNQSLAQAYSLHAVWGNFTDSGGGGCSDHVHTAANAQMVLGLPSSPALNGGSTLSFAPAAGSSLVNAGDRSYCPTYDQRGMPRDTADGNCDIGSIDHFTAASRSLTGPVLDPRLVAQNGGNPNGYKGITQNYPYKFYFSAPVITDPAQHYKLKVWVSGVEHDYETDKNGHQLQDLSLLPLTFAEAGAGSSELWVGAKDQWIKVATGTPFRVLLEHNAAPALRIAMDGGSDATSLNSSVDEFTTHHVVVTVTDPDPGATWSFSQSPSCGANATLSGLTTAAHSFAFDCTVGTGGSNVRTQISAVVVDDQFTTNGAAFLGYVYIVDQPTRWASFTGPNTIPINTTAHYSFTINDGKDDLAALAANPTWTITCGKHLTGPTNKQTSVSGTTLTSSFDCASDGTGLNSFNTYYADGNRGFFYNDATKVVFDPDGSGNAGTNGFYHTHNIPFTVISRLSYIINQTYVLGTDNPGTAAKVLLGTISYPAASTIAHTRIDWGDGTVATYNGWIGTSGNWATFGHPYTSPGKHTVTVSVDQNGALGTWVPVVTADTWDLESAAPVLSLPGAITLSNAVPGQSNKVHYVATATDPINGTYAASCSVGNNATIPVGVTRVTCSATKNGTTASGAFNVTVVDVQAPVIGAPTIIEQPQGDGVHVHLVVPFTDDAPSSGQAVCNPASDSVFAQGTTLVTCTARDAAGNVAKTSFSVAVADGTGPVINAPSSVLGASPNGAGVTKTYNATATDSAGAPLTPVCVPASGSTFAPGTTTVECTATDKAGNVTVARFPVVISGGTVSDMNDLAQQFEHGGGVVSGRRTVTVKLAADLSALTDDDGTGTQLQLEPDADATLDLNGHALTIDAPYGLPAIGVPPTASLHVIDSAGGGKLTVSSHAGAAAIGGGICQSAGDVSIDSVKGTAVSYADGAMTGATGIGSGAEPDAATIDNWGAANVPGDCTATLHGGTVTFTGASYDGAVTTVAAPDSAVGADIAWKAPSGGTSPTLLSSIHVDGEANGIAFSPGGRLTVDLQGGTTTDGSPGGPLGDPDHLQLSEPTRSGYVFGGWRKGSATGPAWSYDPATAASNPESQTSFTVYASWITLRSGTSCGSSYPGTHQCQLVLSAGDDAVLDLRGENWQAGDGSGTRPGIELPAGAKLTVVDSGRHGQITAIGGDGAAGIGGAPSEAAGTLVIQGGAVLATGTGGAGIGGGINAKGGTVDLTGGSFNSSSKAWSGGSEGAGVGAGDGGSAGGTLTVHATPFTGTTNGFPTNGAPGAHAPAAAVSVTSGSLQYDGASGPTASICWDTFDTCSGSFVELGYPVTFHLLGGDSHEFPNDLDTLLLDPKVSLLDYISPTLDGSDNDFAGWYTDPGLTHPIEAAVPLTGPTGVYAKYGNTPLPDLAADVEPDIDPTDGPYLPNRQYFGKTVRVSPPSGFNVPDADVDVDYLWSRCTAQNPIVCTPIVGAPDQPSYTPRLADLGRGLQVTVTASADGYAPHTWTKQMSVVLKNNYIPGERHATNFDAPLVGSTVSLTYDWNFQPQHLDYVWMRDGVPIDGAPGSSSYVVQPADLGAHLAAEITARGDGFNPYTLTLSTGSTVMNSNFTTAPNPTITITPPSGSTDTTQALIGSTLTAVPGTWAPAAQFSYQWYVATAGSDDPIPGATNASYTIPSGSGLKYFYVKVTGSSTGYNNRSAFSDSLRVPVLNVHAQIGVNTSSGATCQNTLSSFGKLAYNEVVCGLLPDLPAGASVDKFNGYQWYLDGVATGNTYDGTNSFRYQIGSSSINHTLSVGITVKAVGYDAVTVMSPTSVVANVYPVTNLVAPVVSGTPAVGQTLQVTNGTWSYSFPRSWNYTWLRDGQAISNATGTSYVVQPADAGHAIRALVQWTGTGGFTGNLSPLNTIEVAASNETGPVPYLTQASTPVPTITGPGEVGSSLTAVPGTWDTGVTLHYAWTLEDGTGIGSDSAQLALTSEMAGHTVSVAVTGKKLGYTDVTRTAISGTTVIGPVTGTMPAVVGSPVVGSTLTAVVGDWEPGVTLTQKWVEDTGTPDDSVAGTDDSITLSAPMVGHTLTLQVTGTKTGHLPMTMYAAPVTVGEGALVLTPTPVVVGEPRVGVTLHSVSGAWDPGVTLTQAWVADAGTDAESVVSTADDFTPDTGLAGHTLTLQVTGAKPGYDSVTKPSAPLDVVAAEAPGVFASTPTPLIAGDPVVGATLVLAAGTWESGAALTQEWVADAGTPDEQVVGTGTSLRLTGDLDGRSLTVSVTGSKPGRVPATVDSDPVTVRTGSLTFTPQPLIMGTPVVGATLTRSTGYWDSGVTLSQEWVEDADGSPQTLGTGTSLKLTSALAGHTVTLVVTGTKTGYAPVTVASLPVTVGEGSVDTTPAVTIAGLTVAGARVGAARSGTWPSRSTWSYVWVQDAGTADTQTLATTGSLALTGAMVGHDITLLLTATPPVGDPVTVSSDPVTVSQGTLVQTPSPVVYGAPVVGGALRAAPGRWDSGVALGYAWVQDAGTDAEQVVGTTTRLVLGAGMLGHRISLRVTGSKAGYGDVSAMSEAVDVAEGTINPAPVVTIAGTPAVGARLSAARPGWKAPSGTQYAYAWTADAGTDHERVVGTASTLTTTAALLGSTLTVTVTASLAGYATVSATSDTVTIAAGTLASTPAPVIAGTPAVGNTLSATTGSWGSGVTFAYAWILDADTDHLTVATTRTYKPTVGQQGHTLTLEVTGTRPGYTSVTRDSDPLLIG